MKNFNKNLKHYYKNNFEADLNHFLDVIKICKHTLALIIVRKKLKIEQKTKTKVKNNTRKIIFDGSNTNIE